MQIRLVTFGVILFFIMLAALGHAQWHTFEVAILNLITQLFTGAKVVG